MSNARLHRPLAALLSALLLLAGALPLVQHVCAEEGAALAWMAAGCCCDDAPTPDAGTMEGHAMGGHAMEGDAVGGHAAHAADAGCHDAPAPPSGETPDACCSVSTLTADLTATPAVPAAAAPALAPVAAPALAPAPAPPPSPRRRTADPPPSPSVRLHLLVATFLT